MRPDQTAAVIRSLATNLEAAAGVMGSRTWRDHGSLDTADRITFAYYRKALQYSEAAVKVEAGSVDRRGVVPALIAECDAMMAAFYARQGTPRERVA